MNNLTFSPLAWDDCLFWQMQDKKTLRRINQLLKDIRHSPLEGLGKPEALKHNLTGCWSRRIDDANRLVYEVSGDRDIILLSCKGHYES